MKRTDIPILNQSAKQSALDAIQAIEPDHNRPMEVVIRKRKLTRSGKMNKCLWKWATMLAEQLNAAGYDMRKFLEVAEYKIDIPWNKENVIDYIWRPVQEARTGYESTTEPTNFQYQDIYQIIDARVAELTGVRVEWPHNEEDDFD